MTLGFSRADRSLLADWWFTVDRALLAAVFALIGVGIILSLAASPSVALKKGFHAFYFVERHIVFTVLGSAVVLIASLLSPRLLRRLALVLFLASLAAMVLVLVTGDEINGARRWLRVAGFSLQPSEFAKPAFVVLSAWAFAESRRRPDVPALSIAIAGFVAFAGLLVLQPDVGQTVLIAVVWGALFLVSGQSLLAALGLAAAGGLGLAGAYAMYGHVRARFDKFFSPTPGDNSQTDRAIQSFVEGGFFGRGPGEGTIKTALPDAHTDFIFAVVAEEYGVLACLVLVGLFAFVVWRSFLHVAREPDPFTRYAVAGLATVFALQALINIGVNVGLVPAKGMTLPFISAGGSSTLAVSLTVGLILALTRRRPDAARLKMPRLLATQSELVIQGNQTS